jgi:hypothetical protein
MGNEVSSKDAAEILRVSVRSVYNMRRQGILRAVGRLKQDVTFDLEEVCALAAARESGEKLTNTELQSLLVQAVASISTLRRRVDSLERLQGVTVPQIGTSQEDVLGLLWKAEAALDSQPFSLAEIRDWSLTFLGIHEEFFDLVEHFAQHPEPWKPFLDLARKVSKDCPPTGPQQSYDVAAANAELDVARRNLRQAAWAYACKRRGEAFARAAFPDTDPNPITHLLHNHVYFHAMKTD